MRLECLLDKQNNAIPITTDGNWIDCGDYPSLEFLRKHLKKNMTDNIKFGHLPVVHRTKDKVFNSAWIGMIIYILGEGLGK